MLKTASIALALSLTFSSAMAQDRKPTPTPKSDPLAQAVERNTLQLAGLSRSITNLSKEISDLKNKRTPTTIELPDPSDPSDVGFAYQCKLAQPIGQFACNPNELAARYCSGKPAPQERNALPAAVGFTGGISSQAKRYTVEGADYLRIVKVLCF
jgi:hypothetical protein